MTHEGNERDTAMPSLDFDLEVAADDDQPGEVRLAALESVMDKAFLSSLVVLPTPGVDETERLFREHVQMFGRIRATAKRIVGGGDKGGKAAGGPVKIKALELKNFFDVFQETVQVIADEARDTPIPEEDDPADDDVDTPEGRAPGDPGGVAIRAAFLPWPRFRHPEESCCCLPLEPCGCGVVVKEFRGLQLRWRRRRITTVIEPWASRATIVFRWVWVLEWVPVQYIKTITTHCECHGTGKTDVGVRVVRDLPLLTFWRGYQACATAHH